MPEPLARAEPAPKSRWRPSLALQTFVGLLLGVLCGLFFGELCAPLEKVGDAFVGLLRMTVLPFIVVSTVANLGRLSRQQSRRLALVGGLVLVGLWAIGLFTVAAFTLSFPEWKAGSFFSSARVGPAPRLDLLEIFVPSNFFTSLADNQVPAVILLCICVGVALGSLRRRRLLIAQLDILSEAFIRVSSFVVRLSPIGVFAIAASTAGTLTLGEAGRLQAYLLAYSVSAVLLGALVLPLLITTLTPFRYRDVSLVTKTAVMTAFATGKLIVVLPMLIEETERLFSTRAEGDREPTAPTVDVLYPLAYAFPHVGKLLAILFIPFAAWFLGHRLMLSEYPTFLIAGLFSYFGGPILATPFLLDLMHLPHDMFQLFLLTGVIGGRVGDALGAMHLAAFVLITTSALTGRLRWRTSAFLRFLGISTVLGVASIFGLRLLLANTLQHVEPKEQVIADMRRLQEPVASTLLVESTPNPEPLRDGEALLARVRRRGVLRVGYNEDKLPFAFFDAQGELVGFDVDMAHALARDLGVSLEFGRFERATLAEELEADHFDLVMSGLVGTLERAEQMEHTSPYLDVKLSFVVPDFRSREFASVERIQEHDLLHVGFVDLSRGFVARLGDMFPNVVLVELASNTEYFERAWEELDALLISAESGAAFTLLYPDFEVVVPAGAQVALPLFYAIGAHDRKMREFLEHWIDLRRKDGTLSERYDHWILGRSSEPDEPRWSVIRDVLGWIE